MPMLEHPFGTFWLALVASAILGWPMLTLMRKVKGHASISKWTPEHAGKVGTPSMGGIAPILALLAVTCYLYNAQHETRYLSLIIGIIGFGLIGFVDDFLIPRYA